MSNPHEQAQKRRVFGQLVTLDVGHCPGAEFLAVSLSKDKTCMVWNYPFGALVQAYILPLITVSQSLDPKERVVYVGYDNGEVQKLILSGKGGSDDVHTTGV
ncbi:hypothetical protein K470DRAFT_258095 [Piedraia hortae CBS 480.64]|uniref:WD40 repeat-like protein n=1 Tax=Piedraia hortae CBS 480.64 TaxID=1314780 RepID=A0A6A7BY89_9PEZI|nr:hypothetical protein K470DRAFT_258095 [Piedraia hortae CBS 480.64]